MTYLWWKHGVVYQVYPRSFKDSSGDGVGDLQGIIEKLDYLVELGIDAIWISPIYPSPMADFGYDVADYCDIHPLFGDLATFDRLLAEAHERTIRVVLDYVPNHTSDQHPWFIESRSSRENAKRGWYVWRDAKPDGSPPNNWESIFGGGAWEWDEATQQYYLHLFLPQQPDLNWRNPAVVKAMHEVLRFWLDRGVDGFRMDVVTFIMKHPDLPDNPLRPAEMTMFGEAPDSAYIQEHLYDLNQPEVHDRLREFRQLVDSYPGEHVTIGETWFMNPAELAEYYGKNNDELHLPFNFQLMKKPWNPRLMRETVEAYYAALPPGRWPNFVLGSHDEHRVATRYGRENARTAAMLLLTLWGTPTWYYGDELGMEDVDIPPHRIQDPYELRVPGKGHGRDPERTPMQWDDSPNAGFAPEGIATWLPLADNYRQVNVAAQEDDPTSMLSFVRSLLAMRREMPVLHQQGDFRFVDGLPEDILAYTRTLDGDTALVVLNYGAQHHTLDLSALDASGEVLLNTRMDRNEVAELAALEVRPYEGILLQV